MNSPLRFSAITPMWVAALAVSIVVYWLPWSPILGLMVMGGNIPLWLLLLAMPVLVLIAGTLNRLAPRLFVVFQIIYFLGLLALHLFFGAIFQWMAPVYIWIALAVSGSIFLPWNKKQLLLWTVSLSTVLISLQLAIDLFYYAKWASISVLVLGTLGTVVVAIAIYKFEFSWFSRFALFFFLLTILIYPRSFLMYRLAFPGYAEAVVSQPGVTAIFDYRDPAILKTIPPQLMYMVRIPGTDSFISGPQNPYRNVLLYERTRTSAQRRIDIGGRGGDNVVFDPQQPHIVYVPGYNSLFKIDTKRGRIESQLTLKDTMESLNFIQYDPETDSLFVSGDLGFEVFVVDRKTFTVRSSIPTPGKSLTDEVWIDSIGKQALVGTRYFIGRRYDAYDLGTMEHKNSFIWPGQFGFNFSTCDPGERKAYLASTSFGDVKVLDLDTFQEIDTFHLEVGLRNLNFDSRRGLILINSYFTGKLFVYNAKDEKVLGSIFLGPRLRWVQVDDENGKWYANSSVGGFEISPDMVLDQLARTQ